MVNLHKTTLTRADTDFAPRAFPLVYTPAEPLAFAKARDEIGTRRDEVLNDLADVGAVLFRGCGVEGFPDFEAVMDALGIEPSEPSEYYGAARRDPVAARTLDVTTAASDAIIPPHVESFYWHQQPKHIAFYCDEADEQWGETPLFDCAAIADSLPRDLFDKLHDARLSMEHIYGSSNRGSQQNESQISNSWQHAFRTEDRAEAERRLDHGRLTHAWLGDDELLVAFAADMMAPHPDTGRLCFRGVRYSTNVNQTYMLDTYVAPRIGRRAYLSRSALFAKLPERFDSARATLAEFAGSTG